MSRRIQSPLSHSSMQRSARPQHRWRQPAIRIRQSICLLGLLFIGAASYGLLWLALIHDQPSSHPLMSLLALQKSQEELLKKGQTTPKVENKLDSAEVTQTLPRTDQDDNAKPMELSQQPSTEDNSPISMRLRKNKYRADARAALAEHMGFDWTFWGSFFCFALLSFVRIRLEPSHQQHPRQWGEMLTMDDSSIAQSLQRVNQERRRRGEPPVSLEAYRALRQILLHDRTMLRALAGHALPTPVRAGATPEQIEACPQHIVRANDTEGDCCICLASFQEKDKVRVLPCDHKYHTDCIDQWLHQSTLCPMCKTAL